MTKLIGSIITDCNDDGARARQELRFKSLFGVQPTFLGVGERAPDIEAAGNLLDQLDTLQNLPASAEKPQAVILVNVAPRGDKVREEWGNGTPFCYFHVGETLVVSAYAGRNLDLVHRRGLVDTVELLDTEKVTAAAVQWGDITSAQAKNITHSQFRSLEFMPLVAYWLLHDRPVPASTQSLKSSLDPQGHIWQIDNFGNAKTTLVPSDIGFEEGKKVTLADGHEAVCHRRLADVPKDTSALTIGSSGYGPDRFLEVVVQWRDDGFHGSDSAAKRHKLTVGSPVLLEQ